MSRNPQMQDDLKFASEAITQIALQAMKSIQELYSKQNHLESFNSVEVNDYQATKEKETDEDARFALLEPTTPKDTPKSDIPDQVKDTRTFGSVSSRPPKYDENFNDLLL